MLIYVYIITLSSFILFVLLLTVLNNFQGLNFYQKSILYEMLSLICYLLQINLLPD